MCINRLLQVQVILLIYSTPNVCCFVLSFKNFGFWTPGPKPLRIFSKFPWGGHGNFRETHYSYLIHAVNWTLSITITVNWDIVLFIFIMSRYSNKVMGAVFIIIVVIVIVGLATMKNEYKECAGMSLTHAYFVYNTCML